MDDEPRSLKAVFGEAESRRIALENSTFRANTPQYFDTVASAVKLYRDSLDLIAALSLFSPNESLEDLSTSDLPFLLTSFHLAELTQRLPSSSPHERSAVLSAARDAHERYLHLIDGYGLLAPPYQKLLERYTDDPTTFSTVSTSDPAARREAKINNFRTEKELLSKLEFLRHRPEYGADGGTLGGGDEGLVREVHLAHLHYSAHMAFQSLDGLNRECEILALAPPAAPPRGGGANPHEDDDARRRQRATAGGLGDNNADYSDRLDQPRRTLQNPGGPLLSKQGRPLQPFTLLGNRQELAKGVFRPGHNLPTMSIDEYLEEEARRGGIIEGGGAASWHRPEPDEDDIEKADAETMKAREWDEFVEANPKGSGNTLNRG